VVEVVEDFDRAWRRVGLALDRTGFTVEDRDRKQGIYFVRYVADVQDTSEKGFFAKLFSSSPKTPEAAKYQIRLVSQGATTVVSVLNATGTAESSETAQRIAKVIADDLK
jgi:outer membrane protein assembly factor BamC